MMGFAAGQRWVSDAEPELGLGVIVSADRGRVAIRFPAVDEQRLYAVESAPLRRVAYKAGDAIRTRAGETFTVAAVTAAGGLLTYRGAEGTGVAESELADALSFGSPDERLLHGRVGEWRDFDLRREALGHQHRRRRSPVRGFVGGRMDLIPHQLDIAQEVAARHAPRVLLADEVGLGKTIEACLITHRLLLSGRAARVLILVPEPLVHQWFVELLRRFNLWFALFDEERCAAIEGASPGVNPFLDDQLVLCPLALLAHDPERARQAHEAGWDLLVVDEAHHLRWTPEAASPEYAVVEALGRRTPGLLLLTATPEQLGAAGHFARLRLLDPDRFHDLATFEQEAAGYRETARIAGRLAGGEDLTAADLKKLRSVFGGDDRLTASGQVPAPAEPSAARESLLRDLLDRHGPGRVMFRNTRAAMQGFPRRVPRPARLEGDAAVLERLAAEFAADVEGAAFKPDFRDDPRVAWLVELLRRLLPAEAAPAAPVRRGIHVAPPTAAPAKVLLICRTREKVLALESALRARINARVALFHEGLELVQRDRAAAWFAEPDGAQLLLASEIGSEGRNFQFAQHLVLLDLPLDPELLEQRIGRLDRIGQRADVQIHLPHVAGGAQEALFRWFHEGLDAFARHLHGGRELLEQFRGRVVDLAQDFHETQDAAALEELVRDTAAARAALAKRLEAGRDRLLELNSFRPERAARLIADVRALDADPALEAFLLRVWDRAGVSVEDLAPRTYRLGGDTGLAEQFPGLPAEGMIVTFDRAHALGREEVAFLTWDHPLVTGALDLLAGGERGGTACAVWPDAPVDGLLLEAVFLLETVAPAWLHADRYLPATPLRVSLDARGQDVSRKLASLVPKAELKDRPLHDLLDSPEFKQRLLPGLLARARVAAEAQAGPLVRAAQEVMRAAQDAELERLRALAQVNPNVRPAELEALAEERRRLDEALGLARVRLDAVRLILAGEE
ncbi:MAG: helicase-related protein [Limisphaerales bacterium]